MRDSAAYWITGLLDFRFYTPSEAALEDLTSGDLGLVRSDLLRRQILGYAQERDRLDIVEERERRFVAEQVEPFLRDHLDLVALLPLRSLDEQGDIPPVDPDEIAPLLDDPPFRSLAYLRWQQAELSHRFARGMGSRLERLTASIDEELGAEEAAP